MTSIPDSFMIIDERRYRVYYDEHTQQFESVLSPLEPVPESVDKKQRVFSYGGGIQSFACLILAAQGLLDFKTFLFCNVGEDSENPKTLEHVEQVAKPFAKKYGLELITLQKLLRSGEVDTVYQHLTRPNSRSIGIPVRMNGNGAPGRRSCTYDFKVAVVDKELRVREAKKTGAIVGIGISLCDLTTDLSLPVTHKLSSSWLVKPVETVPKIGIVQLLTHIRDCGTIFDRARVHWSIHAEMSYFIRLCMDYEDSNWFKPDGRWFKVAKRRFVVEQGHMTE